MKKFIVLLCCYLTVTYAHAWENTVTHKDLSKKAAALSLSDEMLSNEFTLYGKKKSARVWIQDGAELEDSGSIFRPSTARYRNHFHNPLANMTPPIGALTDGGLTDKMTGQSAVLWAQDSTNQITFDQGDWSWPTVREHYYRSLTSTTQADIDAFTARTYLGLGYQMHLLQDMGQPDHIRNDAHPIDGSGKLWGFETWARKKSDLIQRYATVATKPSVDLTQPFYDGYSPVARLMDTRGYKATMTPSASMSQGLSEYTNANFFSDDTIFAARFTADDKHYFPFPRKEGTDIQSYFNGTKAAETVISEDGKAVKGIWISKTGEGESVQHLVRVGPMAKLAFNVFGEGALFYTALGRDEITYEDYAQKLVPRSVGYSAALLDYFFRGNLKVEPITSSDTLRYIRVKATNTTATGEEMPSGTVSLVVKYRLRSESGSVVSPPAADAPWYYRVVTLASQVGIPRDNGGEYLFDLGDTPLPPLATEVKLQMVYKGALGNEADSVATGLVDMNSYTSDIELSLPANGVYAVAAPDASGFTQIKLTAKSYAGLTLPDGKFTLMVRHRLSSADPFQSAVVDTLPEDANAYYLIRASEANNINSLQPGVAQELAFNLPSALPFWASDLYLYLIYHKADDPSQAALATGFADISEPTPVDVFNNTDKVCINKQWYDSGSSEAYAAAGTDSFGQPLDDIFKHQLDNVSFWANTSGKLSLPLDPLTKQLTTASIAPNEMKRLGYILTDYGFDYAFDEQVVPLDPRDDWTLWYQNKLLTGTGFINQADKGFSGMYSIRGKKLWWGTSVIYDNNDDSDINCGWASIQN